MTRVKLSRGDSASNDATIARWRDDPHAFFVEALGADDLRSGIWAQPGQRGYQAEILEALATHDELNVHSGNGIGKDWLAGRIALWWLFTRKDSIVITTAVVEKQVKVILWGELRTAYRRDRHLRGLGEDPAGCRVRR